MSCSSSGEAAGEATAGSCGAAGVSRRLSAHVLSVPVRSLGGHWARKRGGVDQAKNAPCIAAAPRAGSMVPSPGS